MKPRSGNSTSTGSPSADKLAEDVKSVVREAEGLLEATPQHEGLLFSAASGFTQYAYVYLALQADYVEEADLARATHLRGRAMGLYRRAFEYGMRGLEVDHPGFRRALGDDERSALAGMKKDDVPLLYWTSAAWSLQISLDKTNATLAVNLLQSNLARSTVIACPPKTTRSPLTVHETVPPRAEA